MTHARTKKSTQLHTVQNINQRRIPYAYNYTKTMCACVGPYAKYIQKAFNKVIFFLNGTPFLVTSFLSTPIARRKYLEHHFKNLLTPVCSYRPGTICLSVMSLSQTVPVVLLVYNLVKATQCCATISCVSPISQSTSCAVTYCLKRRYSAHSSPLARVT